MEPCRTRLALLRRRRGAAAHLRIPRVPQRPRRPRATVTSERELTPLALGNSEMQGVPINPYPNDWRCDAGHGFDNPVGAGAGTPRVARPCRSMADGESAGVRLRTPSHLDEAWTSLRFALLSTSRGPGAGCQLSANSGHEVSPRPPRRLVHPMQALCCWAMLPVTTLLRFAQTSTRTAYAWAAVSHRRTTSRGGDRRRCWVMLEECSR